MVSNNSLVVADASAPPRLLDRVRARLRLKHYSLRTETAYVGWIKRYIHFHGKRHPAGMGKAEAEAFLTSLAVERNVSAATQNQALSALLFLYREVLESELPWLDDVTRAKKPARLPTVLTRDETAALLAQLGDGEMNLIVRLLYGSGLRLLECLRLRLKDVDLSRRELVVRDGKGGKDRVTMIAEQLVAPLRVQIARARALHDLDLARGGGHPETGDAAHPAPFLRHPFAGGRLRHPHGAGAAGACGCVDDHDLHPCVEQRRARRGQPAGSGGLVTHHHCQQCGIGLQCVNI